MTDTEALPPIAPAAPDMQPATKATASALYAKAGYSPEAITAAGYGDALAAPNVQATAVINVPGTNTHVMVPSDGLSDGQRLSGYRTLLQFAHDKEAVIAEAERAGISREQLGAPPHPAAVAAQQREAEIEGAYAPPADASGYQLQYGTIAQTTGATELAALNGDVTAAFASAGVPTVLAQPLLDAILDTGKIYESDGMTEAGRALRWAEEGSLFKKVSSNPAEDLRLANLAYSKIPAKFRSQLDANYALHSARAQLQLAAVGRAMEYRAAKRKG